jgi:sec-independent protein translocase protein TatB
MVAMVIPSTIEIASIGIPDTLFLMLLALVVFGPRRLPEIGRQIGKLMYEFRKVSNDFKFQMEEELRASEEADRQRKLDAALPAPVETTGSTQATLDVPPDHSSESVSASEPAPGFDYGHGASSAAQDSLTEAGAGFAAAPGEVRGIPTIQPPATGDPIEAARPFRGREPDPVLENGIVIEPGSVAVADEGRTGTEVQPQVDVAAEREAHHA